MKLLAVDHNAVLSTGRGLYRLLLDTQGLDLELLVPRRWEEHFGQIEFEPENRPMKISGDRTLFTGKTHRVLYLSLAKTLKRSQPDILYVNSEPEGYLAAQAVRLRNRLSRRTKVVIVSWRNIDYTGRKFPYKVAWLNAVAEKYVLSHVDHCVAHNRSAKEIYRKLGFDSVTVIPPAVDTELFRKRIDESLREKLNLRGFVIGYFGRFIPEKGVDVLLHAATGLDFEYTLLMAGGGPAKPAWAKLAREIGIERNIVWFGPLRHSELSHYLSCVDVAVLPSKTTEYWKEQFGRILIEAMACEVPVVGSNSGEISNVIGDAGLVFQEGDVEGLRRALMELASDPEKREKFSKKGMESVRMKYALPVVAPLYHNLFQQLVHEQPK